MLKNRNVALLIYGILLFQVLGFLYLSLAAGGVASARVLSEGGWIGPEAGIWLSRGLLGLAIAASLWSFFSWAPWPFFLLGALFFFEALAPLFWQNTLNARFAPLVDAARYLWLFAVGAALLRNRHDDKALCVPSLSRWLRAALAISFAMHGLEAILIEPNFVRLVQMACRLWLPFPADQHTAETILLAIGLLDWAVCFGLYLRPRTVLLVYLAIWGVLTTVSRIYLNPATGWFEASLRASYFGLPILLGALEYQRLPQHNPHYAERRLFRKKKAV